MFRLISTGAAIALMAISLNCAAGRLAGGEEAESLRVGAAAVDLVADDSMVIGGSIGPGRVKGQEGQLRAAAVVIQGAPNQTRLALVACDVLMVERDILDAACRQIQQHTGIPFDHILINATHTHHAPTTVTVHGYERDEKFSKQLQQAIVDAVVQADKELADGATAHFKLSEETTIGQNSRMLLADGQIYWIGSRDDFVRPTGPFDPALPVLAFRDRSGGLQALLFNHSTHTIGTRMPGTRSPSFYGLAAQELEEQLGGTVMFLEGASGSTHNLSLRTPEMVERLKLAIGSALDDTVPLSDVRLASIKREITVKIREFDEQHEDEAVRTYCEKRAPERADYVISVFRNMRQQLADRQGQTRQTWVQAMRIGDVAVVGVPGEYFTKLGLDIKRQSPFRNTIVAELANDWVGYIPDEEAYDLGGYQVWTGLHSYVARGTGEQIVEEAVQLLHELKQRF